MTEFKIENVMYLPSGRIFLLRADDYIIESTEMRDVSVDGKLHEEVRTSLDPHVIWRHLVPFEKKWLMTVSTQYGCPHKCQFCDVGNVNYPALPAASPPLEDGACTLPGFRPAGTIGWLTAACPKSAVRRQTACCAKRGVSDSSCWHAAPRC